MATTSNKRIAKNTVFLYVRMVLIMLVSLYTSRIVLKALGVTDYGIYNVVGGVVTILGILSGSLSGATSRFITFELGKDNFNQLQRLFRCCVSVHYLIGVLILICAETIGLWFVMNKLVIPSDRLIAAFWVYQCCVFSVIVKIISSPYNALIIAHERMNAFAYISIIEVCLQLGLVSLLLLLKTNRLIVYGVSVAFVQIITRLIYNNYCHKNFAEASGRFLWDKAISIEVLKYSFWSLLGFGAVVGYTQGINILLNLFFGPVANAARGFSVQIQNGVNQISTNFQMALRPPTIKSYAQNDLHRMHILMYANAKFSYYLVLFIVVPLMVNTPYILKLWLETVPEYTVSFTRILLPIALYTTLNGHIIIAVHATGDIKKFQIIESVLLLTTLPIAYVLLKYCDIAADTVLFIYLGVEFITQFVRVWIAYPMVGCKISSYFEKILLPVTITTIPIAIIVYFLILHYEATTFTMLIGNVIFSWLIIGIVIYFSGLTNAERRMINKRITNIYNTHIRK